MLDVPQGELFHDDLSNPSFPAASARDKDEALPTIPGKDVALPFDDEIEAPLRPAKPRAFYVTWDRLQRFGKTPGCYACHNFCGKHSDACRTRFAQLLGKDKKDVPTTTNPSRS